MKKLIFGLVMVFVVSFLSVEAFSLAVRDDNIVFQAASAAAKVSEGRIQQGDAIKLGFITVYPLRNIDNTLSPKLVVYKSDTGKIELYDKYSLFAHDLKGVKFIENRPNAYLLSRFIKYEEYLPGLMDKLYERNNNYFVYIRDGYKGISEISLELSGDSHEAAKKMLFEKAPELKVEHEKNFNSILKLLQEIGDDAIGTTVVNNLLVDFEDYNIKVNFDAIVQVRKNAINLLKREILLNILKLQANQVNLSEKDFYNKLRGSVLDLDLADSPSLLPLLTEKVGEINKGNEVIDSSLALYNKVFSDKGIEELDKDEKKLLGQVPSLYLKSRLAFYKNEGYVFDIETSKSFKEKQKLYGNKKVSEIDIEFASEEAKFMVNNILNILENIKGQFDLDEFSEKYKLLKNSGFLKNDFVIKVVEGMDSAVDVSTEGNSKIIRINKAVADRDLSQAVLLTVIYESIQPTHSNIAEYVDFLKQCLRIFNGVGNYGELIKQFRGLNNDNYYVRQIQGTPKDGKDVLGKIDFVTVLETFLESEKRVGLDVKAETVFDNVAAMYAFFAWQA